MTKLLIFTEGTILMHKNAKGLKRKDIIKQVKEKETSVKNYFSYIPIRNAVKKLKLWKKQGINIAYLTSRKKKTEIKAIKNVLIKYHFPKGKILSRKTNQSYSKLAEEFKPDILIEDNCESIGGKKEMTITYIKPNIKKNIKHITIKEFGGIDKLPNKL
jgi:hypothetical protein